MVELLLSLSGTQVHQVKEEEDGRRYEVTTSLTDLQANYTTLSDTLSKFTSLLTR